MTDSSSQDLIDDLEKRNCEMQYLIDHPRIQQKMWVGNCRTWLSPPPGDVRAAHGEE